MELPTTDALSNPTAARKLQTASAYSEIA